MHVYECWRATERVGRGGVEEEEGEEGAGKGSRKLPAHFVVTCGLVLHFHSANCLFIESPRRRHELPVVRLNTRFSFFLSCTLFSIDGTRTRLKSHDPRGHDPDDHRASTQIGRSPRI